MNTGHGLEENCQKKGAPVFLTLARNVPGVLRRNPGLGAGLGGETLWRESRAHTLWGCVGSCTEQPQEVRGQHALLP